MKGQKSVLKFSLFLFSKNDDRDPGIQTRPRYDWKPAEPVRHAPTVSADVPEPGAAPSPERARAGCTQQGV